ncbi:unnamed protein product, partial [Vitis vinifera]
MLKLYLEEILQPWLIWISLSLRILYRSTRKKSSPMVLSSEITPSSPPLSSPPQSAEKPPEKIEEASEKREPNPVAESEISTQEESAKDENVKPTPNPTIESILKHESPTQEDVSIWGIPLLKDERSDMILLKFLRAREFKVKEAFAMLKKNTIFWRKEFGIDALVDDDLGEHLEKRMKFLRWRIQFLERSIRKLDFTPGGVNTIFQVNDLKNSPGPGKWELRQATKQALQLLQDNYPEFVAKQVFINVPWWYLAFYMMISPFLTQRTKNKFVFASSAKSAKTLFKYISPKQVRVVGWEVAYGAEFIPDAEDEYTVVVQKATKMAPTDDPVMCNSSKIKQLRDDLKDMAFEMNSLMEELKVVKKESLIEKFVAGLSMDILQFHTVAPLGDPLLHGLHGHL